MSYGSREVVSGEELERESDNILCGTVSEESVEQYIPKVPVDARALLRGRLVHEGKWEEANAARMEVKRECYRNGLGDEESEDISWQSVVVQYPDAGRLVVTRHPWVGLPPNAPVEQEVLWVHGQFLNVVERTAGGMVVRWERATVAPPSEGAIGTLVWAASDDRNRDSFYSQLWPKVTAKLIGAEEDKRVKEEEMRVEEMRQILGELLKQAGL